MATNDEIMAAILALSSKLEEISNSYNRLNTKINSIAESMNSKKGDIM